MSYVKHTWVDNETITATKLNNIEDGIEEASQSVGGGNAIISLSATAGFDGGSKTWGYIVFATYTNGHWTLINDYYETKNFIDIFGNASPAYLCLPPIPMVDDDNYSAFLLPVVGSSISTTGDISSTPTTLYFSYGSPVPDNAYRITGSGSVEFVY